MSRDASREAAEYRRRMGQALALAEQRQEVLLELRSALLLIWVQGRLRDPADFETYIGQENVVDDAGRIDWSQAEVRLEALLKRKPYLAVSPAEEAATA